MFPTILNTFYWALLSQRLHSRPFLRPDQSRGLPHLPCLLLNSVLLRSMPVGKLSSECNTSKFPFFRKFGINNYSEYSDLIFQQFCKGLYLNEIFKVKLADSSEGNFRLSTISKFNFWRILRVDLDFTWQKWRQRASRWIGNYSDKRRLFADIVKRFESIGFYMIYLDEVSVCPHNVTLYSWWYKYKPHPIIRPSTRIKMVTPMKLPHKYAFMLKTCATKSKHMIFF